MSSSASQKKPLMPEEIFSQAAEGKNASLNEGDLRLLTSGYKALKEQEHKPLNQREIMSIYSLFAYVAYKRVFAHGWWTNEGQKISKSLGNAISPYDLIQTYGLDQTRFFLMRAFPFGNDGDFSDKAIFERVNTCLANGLGNLALRSLTMINKRFDGKLPQPEGLTLADQQHIERTQQLVDEVRKAIDKQAIHRALDEIWDVVSATNKYFAKESPWKLAETDPKRMGTILYVTAESLRHVAVLAQPFMPDSMNKLLDQLGASSNKRTIASLTRGEALTPGTALPAPTVIFPRYVAKELVPHEPKKVARIKNNRAPGF